ncbi:hypothetical protein [Pseudomonas sp. 31 R 17]|nr:hypothetical protein [Pseudomonas sp. 31 R 17]
MRVGYQFNRSSGGLVLFCDTTPIETDASTDIDAAPLPF